MSVEVDILANRRSAKWTKRALLGRAMWECLSGPLFSWTPRPFWLWRRMVLRLFGAHVDEGVHIYPSVKITIPWNLHLGQYCAIGDGAVLYALGRITIGRRTTVSQYAHLCAGSHDFRDGKMTLLKPPIAIGDDAWICADAFIGPGVTVGRRAVVGARAVVTRDVADHAIVAGNPAKVIGTRGPVDSA